MNYILNIFNNITNMSTNNLSTLLMLALLLVINLHATGCVKNWKTKTKKVCDKGFGFKGVCLNGQDKLDANIIPDALKTAYKQFIQPILRKTPFAPSLCFGDFKKDTLTKLKGTQVANCHKFPLDPSYRGYGVVGISVNNVPCGKPVPVNLCVLFDRCGTVGVSFNGGAVACVAAATTGIGAIVSLVAEAVRYAQFGFSYHKKFQMRVPVVTPDYNGDVIAKGHVYLGLGLNFPKKWLKVGKRDLSKYINIEGEAAILVNLGRVGETVTRLINNIKNIGKAGARGIIKTLLNSGAELAVTLKGKFTLKLDKLTKGFFPNIKFDIDTSMVVTTGDSDTGLPAGIYVKVRTNLVTKLLGAIQKVINRFAVILEAFRIPVPNITSEKDIMLGLYITKKQIGFHFNALGQSITCVFKFSNMNASCDFGGKFFSAIAGAAKWVFKTAKKLFDSAGKVVVAIAQGIGKFAINAAKACLKLAKDTVGTVKKVANLAIFEARRALNKAKKLIRKKFKIAKDTAVKTYRKIVKGLRELAKKAKNQTKKAIKGVKNFFAKLGGKKKGGKKKGGENRKKYGFSSFIDKVENLESQSFIGLGLSKKALAQIKKIQMELGKKLATLHNQQKEAKRRMKEQIAMAKKKRDKEISWNVHLFNSIKFVQKMKVKEAQERVKRLKERLKKLKKRNHEQKVKEAEAALRKAYSEKCEEKVNRLKKKLKKLKNQLKRLRGRPKRQTRKTRKTHRLGNRP